VLLYECNAEPWLVECLAAVDFDWKYVKHSRLVMRNVENNEKMHRIIRTKAGRVTDVMGSENRIDCGEKKG